VWHQSAAPAARQKRLLRTVLHEMMLASMAAPSASLGRLHGPGGGPPERQVARQAPGKPGRATAPTGMRVIADLAKVHRALPMAATLKRLGSRTGPGHTWRAPRVTWGR
jgi:hypothetical protein